MQVQGRISTVKTIQVEGGREWAEELQKIALVVAIQHLQALLRLGCATPNFSYSDSPECTECINIFTSQFGTAVACVRVCACVCVCVTEQSQTLNFRGRKRDQLRFYQSHDVPTFAMTHTGGHNLWDTTPGTEKLLCIHRHGKKKEKKKKREALVLFQFSVCSID